MSFVSSPSPRNNSKAMTPVDELTHNRIVYTLQRSIPDLPRIITEISEQKNTSSNIELNNIVSDLISQFQDICSQPTSNYRNNDNKLQILNAEIDYVKELYIKQSGGLKASIENLKTKYSNCSRLLDEATKSLYRTNKDLSDLKISNDYDHNNDLELQNEIMVLKNDALKLKNVIAQLQTEKTQMDVALNEMKTSLNAEGQKQVTLKTTELQTKELNDLNILLRVIHPESNGTDIGIMLSQIEAYLISTKSLNDTIEKLKRDITSMSQKHQESNEMLSDCLQNEETTKKYQNSLQEKISELNNEKITLQNNNTDTVKAYNDLKNLYAQLSERVTQIIHEYRNIGTNNESNSQLLYNLLTVLYDKQVSFAQPADIITVTIENVDDGDDNDNARDIPTDDINNGDDDDDDNDDNYDDANDGNSLDSNGSIYPNTPGSTIENLREIASSLIPKSSQLTPTESLRSSPEPTLPLTPIPQLNVATLTPPPSSSSSSSITQRKRKSTQPSIETYLMGPENDDDITDNTCISDNTNVFLNKRVKSPNDN
ncbi:hypothetical protein DiNV_CH01M_ORF4 [Drosophila innubila nudivirus]|uniref:Uncharacterized protein n=1 Tax=Drosophila innubila nudivirus TaxID=2057187 RepID=A0A2H4UX41_9VIRU|nr:hypothetical protein DiNV_CH01M_ORF4 [Drosophila innubila nudivirus]ATZ81486.1 hypothetical protein DiNV_CH01M_ORF4 [Drosophila innubila nudivirus]